MGLALRATAGLVRLTERLSRPDDLHARSYPAAAVPPAGVRRRFVITTRIVDDQPVLTLVPRLGASGAQLVYLHGGAYVHPLVTAQWWIIDRITRDTGVTITLPLYRLAPEGDVEQTYRLLGRLYDELVAGFGADRVTLAGDSAGAALALGQAIVARDTGRSQPRQVIGLSPWFDVTLANPQARNRQRSDPMLDLEEMVAAGRLWCRSVNPYDPRISAVRADLSGLAPVRLVFGGRDILAPDAELVGRRLAEAGNQGESHCEPGGFHNYLGAHWTPEARTALARVRRWLTD